MAGLSIRRTSDRIEEAGRRGCLVLALLAIPFGLTVAWFSHQSQTAAADRYAASVFHAEAVTLEDASDRRPTPARPIPPVDAKWTGRDGIVHRGELRVPSGSDAGYETPVWITQDGELAEAAPSRAQLVIDAGLLAAKIMLGIGVAAYVAFRLLRYLLDRLREREWDRAWEVFSARRNPG
jgi:hypothetical protein